MPRLTRALLAALVAPCLTVAALPTRAGAPAAGSRLEGWVVAEDGRSAPGYTMHLIDARGRDVRRTLTAEDGVYSFRELPPGSYSLGVENPEGGVIVVGGPPVRLSGRALARRDVRLVPAGAADLDAAIQANPSMGMWWAGMSPAAKVGTVLGAVALVVLTVSALDGGDDEVESSPTEP